MPAPQIASLPPSFTLENGYTVRVTAQDPTNGNTVTGVVVKNVSISVDEQGGASSADLPVDQPWLVPVTS